MGRRGVCVGGMGGGVCVWGDEGRGVCVGGGMEGACVCVWGGGHA